MSFCYCVTYNGYSDTGYFDVEKIFYGENAKEKATEYALKSNIGYLEELCEDCEDDTMPEVKYLKMLKDESKPAEKRLEEYIELLDYSNGNFKYDSNFYEVVKKKIEINTANIKLS